LAALTNLTQISGATNCIQSLNGIQKLTKLKRLNLFGNKIPRMEHF
jgi:Leucine-rich repeat (LRR) protein